MKLGAKELKRLKYSYETVPKLIQDWSTITLEECRKANKDKFTILSALQDTWRRDQEITEKQKTSSSNQVITDINFNPVQKGHDINGNLIGKILGRFGGQIELSELCFPGQLKTNLFAKLYSAQLSFVSYENNDLWTRFKSEFTDEELFYIFFDPQALSGVTVSEDPPLATLIVMVFDNGINIRQLYEILYRIKKFLLLPEGAINASYVLLRLLLVEGKSMTVFQELIDMIWTHHHKLFIENVADSPGALENIIYNLTLPQFQYIKEALLDFSNSELYDTQALSIVPVNVFVQRLHKDRYSTLSLKFYSCFGNRDWQSCKFLLQREAFEIELITSESIINSVDQEMKMMLFRKFVPDAGSNKFKMISADKFVNEWYTPQTEKQAKLTKMIVEWLESGDEDKIKLAKSTIENIIKENNGTMPAAYHFHGWTPLMAAASMLGDDSSLIDRLLTAQADLRERNPLGYTALSVALVTHNFPAFEHLVRRIRSDAVLKEKYGSLLIQTLNQYHGSYLIYFVKEKIIDLNSDDAAVQNENIINYGPMQINQTIIGKLIKKIASQFDFGFDTNEGVDSEKRNLLSRVFSKYPWLKCDTRDFKFTIEPARDARGSIVDYYRFHNEIRITMNALETRQLNKATTTESPAENDFTVSNSGAPGLVSSSDNASNSHNYTRSSKSVKGNLPSQPSSTNHTTKYQRGKNKDKQTQHSTHKGKPSVKKEYVEKTVIPSDPRDIPLSIPGPIVPYYESKFVDGLLQAANVKKEHHIADLKIYAKEELLLIADLGAKYSDYINEIKAHCNDDALAYTLMDLAFKDALFKLNRQVALNNKEKTLAEEIKKFDENLIHRFYRVYPGCFKEQSQFLMFMQANFIHHGIKYFDSFTRMNHPFCLALYKKKNLTVDEKVLLKLKMMDLLIETMRQNAILADKAPALDAITKPVHSTCMSYLGELITSFYKKSPKYYYALNGTTMGEELQLYRKYRNLRHGVNTLPEDQMIIENQGGLELVNYNSDMDWNELLQVHFANRENEINCLTSSKARKTLRRLIGELEAKVEPGVEEDVEALENDFRKMKIKK